MARKPLNPADFGIALDRRDLIDQLALDFEELTAGKWTIDELVLNPREALQFCNDVRERHGYDQLPDDVILRALMNRRKASGGARFTVYRDRLPPEPPQRDLFGQ